jgi:hypothetical protein
MGRDRAALRRHLEAELRRWQGRIASTEREVVEAQERRRYVHEEIGRIEALLREMEGEG